MKLSTYKEHQGVERGFRFIKAPLFHSSQRCFFEKAIKEAYITLDISENEWHPSGSHTGAG
jgi:hypothetical protein